VQKLLANHSNMKLPMQLSAIGVAYLALLAMLRVRMRRGTTAAAGNILELKTQESSVRGQVGWSQQSSKNSRPLTLAMASEGNTPVAEAPEVKAAPAAEMDFGDQAALTIPRRRSRKRKSPSSLSVRRRSHGCELPRRLWRKTRESFSAASANSNTTPNREMRKQVSLPGRSSKISNRTGDVRSVVHPRIRSRP